MYSRLVYVDKHALFLNMIVLFILMFIYFRFTCIVDRSNYQNKYFTRESIFV
jgi:hypothetical protein